MFSSSIRSVGKKALETAGKSALESGTKKIGTEVGNLAANKITEKNQKFKKKPLWTSKTPAVGELIAKKLHEKNNSKNNEKESINIRLNKLLSGSGTLAQRKRINRLIYKK